MPCRFPPIALLPAWSSVAVPALQRTGKPRPDRHDAQRCEEYKP
jgi:hypothetical protein